ncbi:hypothetical protein LPJ38_06575 [Bradyrhizobium daqingense]|uniref:Uncharacterized protein n=1 Tax=Bradyrhizobium daqingense TaxID=993502 RepID=A0A562KXE3_9BRAD|nr:hypothetical protein [Bradyrhizobium daqingense]TWI00091.1 hypothetical protein IQ17_04949 [Bradyrhizobium daqingense]UFS90439.1 hypothetical protein LPJ38_06575 [Bradyrhizobium daqingense]
MHRAINDDLARLIVMVAAPDTDRRMTEEAYAKASGLSPDAVRDRFAASGVLRCPGGDSSAQVTGARDVITTAAHAFRDLCKLHTPPDKCLFEYYRGTEKRTIPLSATLWMGTCDDSAPRASVSDWAVAKLAFPADVKAYEIYERTEILAELERVLAVVGYDILAAGKTDKYGSFNKTMQECQVRDVRDWSIFETNCQFEVGASGSALFRQRDNRMTLLGVLNGDYHDKGYCPRGSCQYKSRTWSSVYVTLKGEFKDRLLAAVSQSAAK